MSKVHVNESDRVRAERLRAFIVDPGATALELATILAEIREEALSCAVVRIEREFDIVPRKQPFLPHYAPKEKP